MRKKIPPVLWISVIALAAISAQQLRIAVQRGSEALLVGAVLNVVVLAGLMYGHRWAYVLTLICGVLGVVVALGKGAEYATLMLIGNGLVVVPMVLSVRFFFPGDRKPEMEQTGCPSSAESHREP